MSKSKSLADTIMDRAHLGGWPPGHSRRIAVALTEAEWWTVVAVLHAWNAAVSREKKERTRAEPSEVRHG